MEQDLKDLQQQGVKTVIDLRMPHETKAPNEMLARSCGLDYANVPVDKTNLSTKIIEDLQRVMRENQGAFLVHCASGMRAAMLLSLVNAQECRWPPERVFDEVKEMGFDLRNSPELSAFVQAATESNTARPKPV